MGDLNQARQEIIEYLKIDIDQFLADINFQNGRKLRDDQKLIICQCLLGYTPEEIATQRGYKKTDSIRSFLCQKVYPYLPNLLGYEQELNQWIKIINLLVKSSQYRLSPSPHQLNDNNFQASFGNQLFLWTHHPDILSIQLRGAEFYRKGLYYQAFDCFMKAWQQEKEILQKGNPEILIYLNNSAIENQRKSLEAKNISIYTIAVIIPVYHNSGRVAIELLRGIAQLQLMVNLRITDDANLKNIIDNNSEYLMTINYNKMVLKVLIVNENNNLYAEENPTAKYLASVAQDLNIMAVIGHYSSEMTKKAVKIYADQGLLLITPSSTSKELAKLNEISLFRMTTPDPGAAERIIQYLVKRFDHNSPLISILYNGNSSYSCSLRSSIRDISNRYYSLNFVAETEDFSHLNEDYYQVKNYLETRPEIKIIIVIPDGGIEPNSLQNLGLISRFSQDRLIIGSATLYHENLLEWLEIEPVNSLTEQIIACVPWHYDSLSNHSNLLADKFCQLGDKLWRKAKVTWRSATAFDSALMLIDALDKNPVKTSQKLLEYIDQFYRCQRQYIMGVTGKIEFQDNCDRLNPPTEIVRVTWDERLKKYTFKPI